jgi:hypothetical protein
VERRGEKFVCPPLDDRRIVRLIIISSGSEASAIKPSLF